MAPSDRQTARPDPFLCRALPSSVLLAAESHCVVDYRERELVISDVQAVQLSREEMHVYGPLPDLEGRSHVVRHTPPQAVLTHYGSGAGVFQ
ncbi:unnamed protein product [Arctogadus glacialis]